MDHLSIGYIRNTLARTPAVFSRGENIFLLGNYALVEENPDALEYTYAFDGNYGAYEVTVSPNGADGLKATCTCPFPYTGCKHAVAAFLDIAQRRRRKKESAAGVAGDTAVAENSDSLKRAGELSQEYLTPEEIKAIALESRRERAKKENLSLVPGEMFKGPHLVRGEYGREYTVTVYNPDGERGHCTCPDFAVNHLDTCKHLIYAFRELARDPVLADQAADEIFPFIHVTWSSRLQKPVCYYEQIDDVELRDRVNALFSENGIYTRDSLNQLFALFSEYSDATEQVRFDDRLVRRIDDAFFEKEAAAFARKFTPDFPFLKATLYPYQEEGVKFAAFRKSAIIADEMGLGKTIQAITTAILKREIFGIEKTLIVCPSSLKNQWKLEIEKFTDERALVISGSRKKRRDAYLADDTFFRITNYEALMRDIGTVVEWAPDLVILDEAQRIKNFETKTHQAINRIPRTHSLVMTGTPLENKLEDLYAIVQFSEPELLTPLWAFAAHHYAMSKTKKNTILGYRNLDMVHEKLKSLLIRRTKKEVFESLPEITENTYYLDLAHEQAEVHQGYMHSLLRIITKKFLTPMDIKMIQKILMAMRMVCDSTYLIDKKSNTSPKLVELVSILREIVIEDRRKVIIFTEWITMTYLIGKVLSELAIDFVEFSGKVPTEKRQALIDEFRDNPDCMVFLSTDAGGVGLNLQNTDCLINIELPWNPAKLNQRIGRIHRIGQKSDKINVINMITRNSIEERVYAGIGLKQELFDAVIDGAGDEVDFSREKKNKFVEELRRMFGDELGAEEIAAQERFSGEDAPELDEKTPHFLNPEIFRDSGYVIDVTEEELGAEAPAARDEPATRDEPAAAATESSTETPIPTEQLEAVLNQGMAFLNTLTQATTGKSLFDGSSDRKTVEIDRETGEVVLRFKLS
ncbi:MAG: helicase [Spirochaetaceae bacterium]|nr:MAG: helicase [Spirochaetaceae bacterium]